MKLNCVRVRATVLLLLLSGCSRPSATGDAAPDIDRLLNLIRQRLVVMHDVARWKWNARAPITDPVRERTILAAIVVQGQQHDLDPAFVRDFFVAQFEAAKRLQEDDFRRWEAERQEPFAAVLDLATELRPKIDRLNGELLAALAALRPRLRDAEVRARLRQRAEAVLSDDSITDAIRETAIGPLVRVQGTLSSMAPTLAMRVLAGGGCCRCSSRMRRTSSTASGWRCTLSWSAGTTTSEATPSRWALS